MRRLFLSLTLLSALTVGAIAVAGAAERSLIITCSEDAPALVKTQVEKIAAAAEQNPLLKLLAAGQPLQIGTFSEALASQAEKLGYAHVIVVGLPSDPLIEQADQREIKFTDDGIYAFGYGAWRGDLGWVESGFNPWLHSPSVASSPYESQTIVLTGNTPAGVELAVRNFLEKSLLNGLVSANAESLETTVLDWAPPELIGDLPEWLPASGAGFTRLGVSYHGATMVRNLLQASGEIGAEPLRAALVKYYREGSWDLPGNDNAITSYLNGLHRLAYGQSLLLLEYADAPTAQKVAAKLANEKRFGADEKDFRFATSAIARGQYVILSNLGEEFNREINN